MAQTTDGMSFVAAYVFCSPDGSTWTDVSGHGASVAVSGGERATGEQNTMDGVTPIVKGGKKGSLDVTVAFVYTETASDPFDIAQAAHESVSGAFQVQYRALAGGNWFSSGAGFITNLVYPQGDAADGTVIMSEFVVKCAGLTEAAAST